MWSRVSARVPVSHQIFLQKRDRHVKTALRLMSRFFTRERFGAPQFTAGLLLLAFLASASGWLAALCISPTAIPMDCPRAGRVFVYGTASR